MGPRYTKSIGPLTKVWLNIYLMTRTLQHGICSIEALKEDNWKGSPIHKRQLSCTLSLNEIVDLRWPFEMPIVVIVCKSLILNSSIEWIRDQYARQTHFLADNGAIATTKNRQ